MGQAYVKPENCASKPEVMAGADDGSLLIMDLRTPGEVSGGKIDAKRWINLSWSSNFKDAFALSGDDFKTKYGISKPAPDGSDLILYCQSGGRSSQGVQHLLDLGYTKVRHYPGGYGSW